MLFRKKLLSCRALRAFEPGTLKRCCSQSSGEDNKEIRTGRYKNGEQESGMGRLNRELNFEAARLRAEELSFELQALALSLRVPVQVHSFNSASRIADAYRAA